MLKSLNNSIAASRQGSDDVLAIEFHQDAHELIDREMEGIGQGVDVNLAAVTDDIDHSLFLLGQIGEEGKWLGLLLTSLFSPFIAIILSIIVSGSMTLCPM